MGAYLFAWNIWRTIGTAAVPRAVRASRTTALPVVEG
jgi:hypothetical protein